VKGRAGHAAAVGPAALSVEDLHVAYAGAEALRSVSFSVEPGQIVAVLGANGAGKSTLASALAGLVTPVTGHITLDGVAIDRLRADQRARLGIGFVPDFRAIYPSLSVAENLRMAFHRAGTRRRIDAHVAAAYELFPRLRERRKLPAGTLSGGEQQMLALSPVIVNPPRLVMVDELSHGLAPGVVRELVGTLAALRGRSTVLVIEQYVTQALAMSDSVIVLSRGRIAYTGRSAELTTDAIELIYSLGPRDAGSPGPERTAPTHVVTSNETNVKGPMS
jgi:branched-chain amino acid transport system ATP-binding protein